ncbi:MAG: pseudouridine synthase [Bacillota bacterium]
MRLNKYIADCGVASRRAADKMIEEGRVKVNGKSVTTMGATVDEYNDSVTVDNNRIAIQSRQVYLMLNKPKGCLCTMSDDRDRKTIMDYVNLAENRRLFPVGRLDYDSEGLLLLTNDGDLAYKLTHPSHEIPKTYIAKIDTEVPENDLATLRNGIEMDGIKLHKCKIKLAGIEEGGVHRYEVTIFEGRNREIRRMFETVGKDVLFLKRAAVGDLRLGGLSRGKWRYLTDREVDLLKRL